jgi:hypothetical protein
MKAQGKFGKLGVLAVAMSLLSLSTVAAAETDSAQAIRASAAAVPTNIPGIYTYAEPPEGFNPVTATNVELATYGFPPRPDQETDPDRYAAWQRAMTLAKIRWNGELIPATGTEHVTIPASSSIFPEVVQPETGPQVQPNVDASGIILTNTRTSWSDEYSFNVVSSVMSVPIVQLPFGANTCTYDYKEFSFAGIDSLYENLNGKVYILFPGLQGGVYGDVPCSGGSAGTPFYYAEFGWSYPLSRGFAVTPGDVFFTYVQAYGGSTNASVYLEDLTTQVYASYSISTPGIVGHNADWLVFRPCCTGGSNPPPSNVFPLANTVGIFFDEASALTGNDKVFYPNSLSASTLILNMMDDGGDQIIETVNHGGSGYEGENALMFSTSNCAYSGGCVQ